MEREPAGVLGDPARLAALRRLELLDHPPRESFERVVDLAIRVLSVPAAFISLVEPHRHFFTSCAGLPGLWAERRETPLSHSFCQYTVARGEPLVIEDARAHPLVRENLAIPDLRVVADVLMPRLGGMELARRIHEVSPHTRVILMSGYAEEVRRDAEALPGGVRFLAKPFLPERLEAAVEELLPRTSER
jgi:CheY-like chemotaxis protein